MEYNETVRKVASITGNSTMQLQAWYDEADDEQRNDFETLSETSAHDAWSALYCIHDAYQNKAVVDTPLDTSSPSPRTRGEGEQ